MFITAIMS